MIVTLGRGPGRARVQIQPIAVALQEVLQVRRLTVQQQRSDRVVALCDDHLVDGVHCLCGPR
ncbi:hypothetical protein DMH12_02050 [Streptomyces sp. WAC 04229]|nr:hypothetical protein DMH12_02050 [Streptomyces sp. WAC 04229]